LDCHSDKNAQESPSNHPGTKDDYAAQKKEQVGDRYWGERFWKMSFGSENRRWPCREQHDECCNPRGPAVARFSPPRAQFFRLNAMPSF
jgi:hypothetical protein